MNRNRQLSSWAAFGSLVLALLTVSPEAARGAEAEQPQVAPGDPAEALDAGLSPVRSWTDRSGQYRTEASLVGLTDQVVHLRRTDGRLVTVPREQLSDGDRAFLVEHFPAGPVAEPGDSKPEAGNETTRADIPASPAAGPDEAVEEAAMEEAAGPDEAVEEAAGVELAGGEAAQSESAGSETSTADSTQPEAEVDPAAAGSLPADPASNPLAQAVLNRQRLPRP